MMIPLLNLAIVIQQRNLHFGNAAMIRRQRRQLLALIKKHVHRSMLRERNLTAA
jgi:hypothetical protein